MYALAFAPKTASAARLYLGQDDGTIRAIDLATGRQEVWHGHDGAVTSLAVTESQVVSGSEDGTVRTWSTDGHAQAVVDAGAPVRALAFFNEGRKLAVLGGPPGMAEAASHRKLRIWEWPARRLQLETGVEAPHLWSGAAPATLAADGWGGLVGGAGAGGVRFWGADAKGRPLPRVPSRPGSGSWTTWRSRRTGCSSSERARQPRRTRWAGPCSGSGTPATPLSPTTCELDKQIRSPEVRGSNVVFGEVPTLVSVAPDGKTAIHTAGGTLEECNLSTRKVQRVFSGPAGFVAALAYSPQGDVVATASLDGAVRLWSTASGKVVVTIAPYPGRSEAYVWDDEGIDGADSPLDPIPECHVGPRAFPFEVCEDRFGASGRSSRASMVPGGARAASANRATERTDMATTHIVEQGECLSSIAADYGFADYRTIYNAPENADFRAKRPNPNLIYPGDSLVIPDRATKSASISTGAANKIVVNGTSRTLCLALRDLDGNALSYRLEVDGVEVDGAPVSGVDGALQYTIGASVSSANVCIDDTVIPLQIASLNLLSADAPDGGMSGARGGPQLANLGYDVSERERHARRRDCERARAVSNGPRAHCLERPGRRNPRAARPGVRLLRARGSS